MKVIANNITYNETEFITVNVNASGNVTIKVNNCEETIALKEGGGNHLVLGAMVDEIEKFKGISIVDIPGLNAGNYTIEVTYNGNDNYNSSTEVTEFTVFKASSALAADDLSIFYSSAVKLVATLKDGRGNPIPDAEVNVAVGDIAETLLSNENGEVYLDIGSLAPGNHTANFTFTGNENYIESNTVANVIVNAKIDTAIFVVYDSDAKKLVATLTNAEGKALVTANLVVSIDGGEYALKTNSKGQAKLSTADLAPGNYTASVTYKGNSKYNPASATEEIAVQ